MDGHHHHHHHQNQHQHRHRRHHVTLSTTIVFAVSLTSFLMMIVKLPHSTIGRQRFPHGPASTGCHPRTYVGERVRASVAPGQRPSLPGHDRLAPQPQRLAASGLRLEPATEVRYSVTADSGVVHLLVLDVRCFCAVTRHADGFGRVFVVVVVVVVVVLTFLFRQIL